MNCGNNVFLAGPPAKRRVKGQSCPTRVAGLLSLPDEVLFKIATNLQTHDLLVLSLVNKRTHRIASNALKEFKFHTSGFVEEGMTLLWRRQQILPQNNSDWPWPFYLLSSMCSFMFALATIILDSFVFETARIGSDSTAWSTEEREGSFNSLLMSPMALFKGTSQSPEKKLLTCAQRFPRLTSLRVTRAVASLEALANLKRLQRLRQLNASNCLLTGDTLTHITALGNLTTLNLDGSCLTGTLWKLNSMSQLRVLSLGDCFLVDKDIEDISVLGTHLESLSLSENLLKNASVLRPFRALKQLNLSLMNTLTDGWDAIGELTSLRDLILALTNVSEGAVFCLIKLEGLQRLCLSNSGVQDEGALVLIHHLSKLEELDLSGCHVSDHTAVGLAAMPNLCKLDVSSTLITDEGLRCFANNRRMQHLGLSAHLERNSVTDQSMAHIATMTSLKELAIDCCHISDAGLKMLLPMECLEAINITNVSMITDNSVHTLLSLPALRAVAASGCGLSEEGMLRLRQGLGPKGWLWDTDCLKRSFQANDGAGGSNDLKSQVMKAVTQHMPPGPAGSIAWW